jgi:hypothetical protein
MVLQYSKEAQAVECDHDHELGYLNTTIRQVSLLFKLCVLSV